MAENHDILLIKLRMQRPVF